jgi:hypothetical protein
VIDERPDREEFRELGHAAVVIRVEMRDEKDVDPADARGTRCSEDSIRVARLRGIARNGRKRSTLPWKTGVDEERLTARRDDERRLSAFDVDEVDIERAGRRCRKYRGGAARDRD